MSASFPQVAFWVIFPLAALVVLSGWVMIIISAVKKVLAGKQREGNDPINRPFQERPLPLQPNWTPADGIAPDGTPAVSLLKVRGGWPTSHHPAGPRSSCHSSIRGES